MVEVRVAYALPRDLRYLRDLDAVRQLGHLAEWPYWSDNATAICGRRYVLRAWQERRGTPPFVDEATGARQFVSSHVREQEIQHLCDGCRQRFWELLATGIITPEE